MVSLLVSVLFTVGYLASGDADPASRPILPVLFFPDRGVVLEGIDSVLAGGKGFGPVRTADGNEDADFANSELTRAVMNDNACDIGPLLPNLHSDLLEYLDCHGLIGLVFEGDDGLSVGLVADHAAKKGDRTVGPVVG